MIIYFISALLISFVLFTLGSYSTIISLMASAGKVMLALLMVVALVLLYRKLRGSSQLPKLPWVSDK